jgi:phosphatidylinositol alpha-1,6-mannosyltransferase
MSRRTVSPPSLVLGLVGLEVDGGIAAVSRCIASALDDAMSEGRAARADRVLLLEDPAQLAKPPLRGRQLLARGRQPVFVWQLWRSFRRSRASLVIFAHMGLAKSVSLPLPGFPPRYAIFCHGIELGRDDEASRRAFRGAWRLLANSERTGASLRQRFPEQADAVRVVPLCIDPGRTRAWESEYGAEAPAQAREPAVLIVGRMWAEQRGKGHDALLEAWPAVRRQAPEAELWIAGRGDDVPRLEQKAGELGVAEAVQFLGHISDEQLARRYRRAALFCMPSRQEGFGLVYAEAMWHGTPCIGSHADAAAEVIREGETGLLVPYGEPAPLADAIVSLLADSERRRRMGEAGMLEARQRFGYERFRSDLLAALEL